MALIAHYPLNGTHLCNLGTPAYISGTETYSLDAHNGKASLSSGNLVWEQSEVSKYMNNEEFSYSVWVKPTATTGTSVLFGNSTHGRRFSLFTYPSPTDLHLSWQNDSGTVVVATSNNGVLNLNKWNNVIVTYKKGKSARIFVNGELIETYNGADHNTSFSNSGNVNIITSHSSRLVSDLRIFTHELTDMEIKELSKGLILHYAFDTENISTTNLISRDIDSYPKIGNSHGVYDTLHYNNNSEFSMGTVASISNNIVTFSNPSRTLYTYDVIFPKTSGGGLNANTEYFVKKHGVNQYSFHTYVSTQDGSRQHINSTTGGFDAHVSVDTDARVSISSSGFPTRFQAHPHRPNQSIIKQIVPNGFNGHESMRIISSFRYPDPVGSYMAYGVYPSVEAGKYYSFSFWVRAINDTAVGSNMVLTLYTNQNWTGGDSEFGKYAPYLTLTRDWQRYEMVGLAPSSGGTNMYFRGVRAHGDIEISEIQCELRYHPSEYTSSTRTSSNIIVDSSGLGNHSDIMSNISLPGHSYNTPAGLKSIQVTRLNNIIFPFRTDNEFWKNSDLTISSYIKIDKHTEGDSCILGSAYYAGFGIGKTSNGSTTSIFGYFRNNPSSQKHTTNFNMDLNKWYLVTYVLSRTSSNMKLYIDGQLYATTSIINGDFEYVGQYIGINLSNQTGGVGPWNPIKGGYSDVRIYATALSDEDIMKLYKARAELSNDGTLYSKGFVEDENNYLDPHRFFAFSTGTKDPGFQTYHGVDAWRVTPPLFYYAQDYDKYPFANQFKTNTQYIMKLKISHNTYYSGVNGNVPGGFGVTYTDGTVDYLTYTSDGDKKEWRTFNYISRENKTIRYLHVYYYVGDIVYVSRDSYMIEYKPKGIQSTGVWDADEVSTVGITEGMVGYWPLDGNAKDYSGNNRHGEAFSSTSMPENLGQGYSFKDGTGIKLENILSEIDRKDFSIVISTKPTLYSGTTRLAMGYPQNNFELNIRGGYAGISLRDSSGWASANGTSGVPVNTKFLYTVTFDGDRLKYYQDGIFQSQSRTILNDLTFGSNLLLGNWTSLTQSYKGDIYYVKIFNRALTPEEIKIEYNTMFNNKMQIHESGTLYVKDIREY